MRIAVLLVVGAAAYAAAQLRKPEVRARARHMVDTRIMPRARQLVANLPGQSQQPPRYTGGTAE